METMVDTSGQAVLVPMGPSVNNTGQVSNRAGTSSLTCGGTLIWSCWGHCGDCLGPVFHSVSQCGGGRGTTPPGCVQVPTAAHCQGSPPP